MSIQQKILQTQGLTDYETYIVDSLPTSKYFKVFSLEDTIPGGRSTFQILGSEFLEDNVELKIELIDINGNVVYTEPIKYLGDDPSRHIMIEVYPTTAMGVGTLTILGSVVDVPDEWKGLYNVKWEKEVFIDPVLKNTQPILFRGQGIDVSRNQRYPLPEIEVVETVTGVMVASGSGGNDFVTSSLFEGGTYDGNASPFARPMHIRDLVNSRTQESVTSPPAEMVNAGIGGGQTAKTTYAAKPKNQQNTSDTTAIETNVVEQKYEEFHEPQAQPSPPPTPPIPPVASKPKTTPPVVETKAKQPDAVGKGTLIKRQSGEPFRLELAGGTFKADPVVSDLVEGIKGRPFESSSFTASIVAVHSPDLLEIDSPYLIRDDTPEKDDTNPFIPVPHTGSGFTIDYEPVTTGSVSEVILQSFAEITIKNMRTFSGDVHRVKVFTKGFSTQGDFRLVSDKIVESSDVLINTGSVSLTQKTGKFIDQQHIDNNWQIKHIKKGSRVETPEVAGTATFTSSVHPPLMNATLISGSNCKADESIVFETTTPKLKLRPNVDYTLSVNAILKTGKKDVLKDEGLVESQSRGQVRFYLSGSNLSQDLGKLNVASSGSIGNILGDPVKVIQTEDESQGEIIELKTEDNELGKTIDFGRVKIPFKPQFSGSGITINDDTKLQVEVEAGELFIQSIEIAPSSDTNFNPDEFTFQVPMPKLRKRPDLFDFLIEFYDRDGNKSSYSTIKEAVEFDGENDVIQGTNNLLTGSLSIGNALGAGIEAAGVNSAFIRSVDYAGFDSSSVSGRGGFVMWSGSISRSLNTSESYDGVGIELHDGNSGSFKFRTLNSDGVGEFDVRTNKFFFGKEGVQFVSGSDNQIEISSSNFHLKPDGGLTIGGDANILSSLSANSILVPGGSTSTNAVASITDAGAARFTSASIGGFIVNDTQIKSANNNLILSSSGGITGSDVLLTSGKITSNVTVEGSFAANSLSLPSAGTPTAIVTAQGEATFSKAEIGSFKISDQEIRSLSGSLILSASGAITASDVLITGTLNATAGTVSTSLGSLGHLSESLELFTGSIVTDLTSSISKSIEITREEVAKATASYGAGTASFDTRFDTVGTRTASLILRSDKLELKTGSIDDVFAEVSHSFGLATGSLKTIVTESFDLNSSSVDFASSGSQIKSLVFSSESIVRADASASIVSESVVIKSLLFSSESITRADTSASVVLASASAEFEASASLISDKVDFASSGSQIISLGFATESNVRTDAGLAPIKTDFTQSRFEVTTLQSQATQSIGELGTLQTETTTSLNKLGGITTASGSFLGAIGSRSASMDATISSSFTLSSASIDFAATGSQVISLGFASESITRADTSSSFAVSRSDAGLASASAEFVVSGGLLNTRVDFASSGSQIVSLGLVTESITRADTSASLVSASAVITALNFSSESITRADTSASLVSASAVITAKEFTNAGLAPIKTDFTQSRFEVTTLQSQATQSSGELISLQAETTTSLNKLGGITTASGSFLGAIGARSASMDATISSSFTLSSASLALSGSLLSGSIGVKINPYETQVSLSGDGLAIRKEDETLLAKYGEKTELFAGGNTAHKAILDTSGLALVESNVTSAFFGGTTTIGPEANNKSRVEIGSGAVKIINQDGSGNSSTVLNFDSTGDVTSDNFLLERTRLFGAGGDGVITLKHNTATVATGSNSTGAGKVDNTLSVDSNSMIVNEQGTRVLTRTGSVWSLEGDLYADSLEVDNSTGTAPTLVTSGSRIFVKNEFKIDSSCVVHNDGNAGEDGANSSTSDNSTSGYGDGGANTPTRFGTGGKGNALSAGTDGQPGSRGGNPGSGGNTYGGNGGAGGGSGGIIFISARFLVNSGSIRSLGGDGGDGGNGTGELPGAGDAPADGGAGAAGSLINIKV